MENQQKKIVELIKNNNKFLLLSHKNPDGDAIGSSLALCKILRKMRKKSYFFLNEKMPVNFIFLSTFDYILKKISKEKFDITIVLDCAEKKLLPISYFPSDLSVSIDHHLIKEKFTDYLYCDTNASSVGEQIFSLMNLLKCPLDKEIATDLYLAIMTDTGNFRFSNTTSRTHDIVSTLLKYGEEPSYIYSKTYDNKSLNLIKAMGEAFTNLKTKNKGKIVWTYLDYNKIKKFKVDELETREIIDTIRSIKDVEVAVLFKEFKKKEIKVSLRSNGKIDVNKIAMKFSGGGHRLASGCTVKGKLQDLQRKIIKEIKKSFNV